MDWLAVRVAGLWMIVSLLCLAAMAVGWDHGWEHRQVKRDVPSADVLEKLDDCMLAARFAFGEHRRYDHRAVYTIEVTVREQ